MAVLRSTVINDTGYLSLPSGTTAQRLGETNTTLVYFTSCLLYTSDAADE